MNKSVLYEMIIKSIPTRSTLFQYQNIPLLIRKYFTLQDISQTSTVVAQRSSSINDASILRNNLLDHHNYSRQISGISNFLRRQNYSKKRKRETRRDDVEEESDDDNDAGADDLLDKYDKNSKVIKTNVTSLRLDVLIKSGLGLSRNKIDSIFYESRLRVNGLKVTKKSQRLKAGDEVDVVKGFSSDNGNFLNISRIEILAASGDEEEESIEVKIRRFKQLTVDNYDEHPWKEVTAQA